MIVLDANILLYAYDVNAPLHQPARRYLERIFSAPDSIGIPLQSILAFLRISTQRGALPAPYSSEEAVDFVNEWLALPQVRLLTPGDRHWSILRGLVLEGHAAGRLVTDAEIAAITIEHAGELHTHDRGFARFPGLRWKNPLPKA